MSIKYFKEINIYISRWFDSFSDTLHLVFLFLDFNCGNNAFDLKPVVPRKQYNWDDAWDVLNWGEKYILIIIYIKTTVQGL